MPVDLVCLSGREPSPPHPQQLHPPPPPVTVNNNGNQVDTASSTPAGLELHLVLRCQHCTRSERAARRKRRSRGSPSACGREPVDLLHRSDVTREQSRLNAASATPNR